MPKHNRRTIIGPHAAGALRLLIFTGARLREILHLRWEHVEFDRGLLLLPDSKTDQKTIILNAPALAILAELPRVGAYVIAGEDPAAPRANLKRPWEVVARHAGLASVRLHDLRHTSASVGAGRGLGSALPVAPSLRIRTSPGRGHEYLLLDPADPLTPEEAERVNRHIAETYGGDRQATDLARVLRLAGSWHLKSDPHRVEIIGGTGMVFSCPAILSAFPEPIRAPLPQLRVPIVSSDAARRDRYVAGTLRGVLDDLARAAERERNATLNRCAYRLGQVGINVEESASQLTPTALAIGLGPHETFATITSGVRAGAEHPRLMRDEARRAGQESDRRPRRGAAGG